MNLTRMLCGACLAVLMLCWAGCAGSKQVSPPDNGSLQSAKAVALSVEPMYASTVTGISYSGDEQGLVVRFAAIPARGQFVKLTLPSGYSAGQCSWSNGQTGGAETTVLTLAVPTLSGLELGVVPLASYAGNPVTLEAAVTSAARSKSTTPIGGENCVTDLEVVPFGEGKVRLCWTQVNAGDYNFDGTVDLMDMRVVAEHYGATIDRSSKGAVQATAYWVDGSGDGKVDGDDISTILGHYGAELAGYNVRCNGTLLKGAASGQPTVPAGLAVSQPGLPPRYDVEFCGGTASVWSVTAVGSDGVEGASGTADPYSADLLVTVTISGIGLADLAGSDPGEGSVVKQGSRVIDPLEDVGRPTLARPIYVSGNTAIYSNLPRDDALLLDVRYLPVVSLATGLLRTASALTPAAPTVDSRDGLQATAIPFSLPESGGMLTIKADISVSENPAGGYYITLHSTTSSTEEPLSDATTRLSYVDGVLVCDSDDNGQFADEAQFLDTDRDQVSNQRMDLERDTRQYPANGLEQIVVWANLASARLDEGRISVDGCRVLKSDAPPPPDGTSMRFSERTEFAGPLDPNQWQPGQRLSLDLILMHDPSGVMPDAYWVERAELIDGGDNGPGRGALSASEDLPGRIELSWTAVPGFSAFRVERWRGPQNPGFPVPFPDWSKTFSAAGPCSFTDVLVAPGARYRYRYYGVSEREEMVLLGEDFGRTAGGPPGPAPGMPGIGPSVHYPPPPEDPDPH